jgi:hypothetical protein
MAPSQTIDSFCLYLWRSKSAPGTLYLANSFETAEMLCRGLTEDGYIVKVIHTATNMEFELCEGKLRPPSQPTASFLPRTESGLSAN